MLSIRDEDVRMLAQDVMRLRGTADLASAIRLALTNEVARAKADPTLFDQVRAMRDEALAKAMNPPTRFGKTDRDALWGD